MHYFWAPAAFKKVGLPWFLKLVFFFCKDKLLCLYYVHFLYRIRSREYLRFAVKIYDFKLNISGAWRTRWYGQN